MQVRVSRSTYISMLPDTLINQYTVCPRATAWRNRQGTFSSVFLCLLWLLRSLASPWSSRSFKLRKDELSHLSVVLQDDCWRDCPFFLLFASWYWSLLNLTIMLQYWSTWEMQSAHPLYLPYIQVWDMKSIPIGTIKIRYQSLEFYIGTLECFKLVFAMFTANLQFALSDKHWLWRQHTLQSCCLTASLSLRKFMQTFARFNLSTWSNCLDL